MWKNHYKYSYNKAVSIINQEDMYIEPVFRDYYKTNKDTQRISRNIYYSDYELRNIITPELSNSKIKWILRTPKGIREHAVFEANKNLKSAISNMKNGHIKHFNLGYLKKKNIKWTIGIPKDAIKCYENEIGIYEARTTNFRIKTTETINEINNDCLIHFDGLHYYICYQKKVEKKTSNKNWFCALDPGIRKFQTLFSPDNNESIIIGDRASSKIYDKLISLDNLTSKSGRKNEIKKRKLRMHVKNLQTELHNKTINMLCENYQNVFIPKLTKNNDIIKKSKKRIKTKEVRKMVLLGHCKFVERLKTKASTYKNVLIHEISEEYTSQICLRCDNKTKTKKEVYKCKFCGYSIDRDILGSVNILLKNW